MKRGKTIFGLFCAAAVQMLTMAVSCEKLDNDAEKHASDTSNIQVSLNEVAEILSAVPLQQSHLDEVYKATSSSISNGYDEEYMMCDLFDLPGKGVGEVLTRSAVTSDNALRDLIEDYVRSQAQTKSGGGAAYDADKYLEALTSSDIQIYWPYSENWDGKTMPIITFDPEDGSDVNMGYRLCVEDDGSRHVEEVIVDEEMATREPVWVVNRNSDAGYTTLEILRREDPDWGNGGGDIVIKPKTKAETGEKRKCLRLKKFTMLRNYDCWLAGGSEFFVKIGAVDDFTASTEAELRLYNPKITDFMVVVPRSKEGVPLSINAILISDWNPQMTHCALLINEDDGGTRESWKCTALVRIASKSYGIEIDLPIRSFDDIVWRGQLAWRWLEANSNITGRFGDVNLTFDVLEY